MEAEIIAVGTEVLMGQVENTNGTFLSQALNALGFNVYHESVVGDNPKRLLESLQLAASRSQLIVLCGGLGPTPDDLTKQVVAEFLGRSLVENTEAFVKIQQFFKQRQKPLTPNNRLQALTIEGGIPLKNSVGLAVGTFITQEKNSFLLLPGPPHELQPMFQQVAKPLLQDLLPKKERLVSEVLRFYGIGESRLATDLQDLIAKQTNPTIATYAKPQEVTIRISAKADSTKEALALLTPLKDEILSRVGEFYYASGEEVTLGEVVAKKLCEKNLTITACESLTAGLFQSTLAKTPGISQIFLGGLVTYASKSKEKLANVSKATIAEFGVVSSQTAKEMAENTRQIFDTDLALSFTGVAGPETLEGKAAGTVWIGLAQRGKLPEAFLFQMNRDRNGVRQQAVKEGFNLLLRKVLS